MSAATGGLAPARGVHAAPPLAVERVSKSFGAVRAVSDVSFAIEPGSLTCLIGPNGAGKSTLLHCISGRRRHDRGAIRLAGADVSRLPAYSRARQGLASVFQSSRPLESLDVLSNAMLGAHAWTRSEFATAIFRLPRHHREEREITQAAKEALGLVGLEARAHDSAAVLPFGQLRLLAVARALTQRPRVLLLDEPAAGLRAGEKRRLVDVLAGLRTVGLTQILVEHDMQFVGALADRVIVLNYGELIADGTPQEIRHDERVRAAYLGSGRGT